jgi:hypothetical protein
VRPIVSRRVPDFIIGGAPRSGTTWLYTVLDRHPSVFMAKPVTPEPKFFLRDDLYAKGMGAYAALFADAKADQLAGEKSTNYLESPRAAERIRRDLPGVKLVFVLRDPVARAYSNYLWSKRNGREDASFEDALTDEDARERDLAPELRYARPHAYFSRGLYAELLAPYFALFPRDDVLCLAHEQIESDPERLAARAHRFLGVAERPEDARGLDKINSAAEEGPPLSPEVRRRLESAYVAPNQRLHELLGPEFPIWKYGP